MGTGTSVGSYPIISYKDTTEPIYEITAMGMESESWVAWEYRGTGGKSSTISHICCM